MQLLSPLTASHLLFAALFIIAGVSHFLAPRFFLYIMPKWVPAPRLTNHIVGIIEASLGIALLFDPIGPHAAWALVLLLIAVFPANINHFLLSRKHPKYFWISLFRLPIQPLLIYWAYTLT